MAIRVKNESNFNIRRDVGVYLIRCIPTDRIYIGSTKQSFRARFSNHNKFLSQGTLGNKKLQADFNIYGESNFEFEILGTYPEELTVQYEKQFIDDLKPYYNVNRACNNSRTNLNKKFTDEHKEKIRAKAKLYKHNEECLERLSKINTDNAAQYEIVNLETGETFIRKFKDIRELTGGKKKGWSITKLKKQAKTIYLLVDDDWMEFSSYEKCDKFLNKWRGYTSTKMLKGSQEIDGYKVEMG